MVPTGTFKITSPPSRPVLFEPSPCRPRSALCSGLNRKCTSVLCRSLDSITTSPPLPPSPPDGTPRGTNFSQRNAMHPYPPSPALTRIFASSMNIADTQGPKRSPNKNASSRRRGGVDRKVRRDPTRTARKRVLPAPDLLRFYGFDHYELAHRSL